jgi:O-antigen/teichoic acid export membrane protein
MDNSFAKKFFKGLVSSSFGTAATVVFHFLSIMAMVRYATVDDFGLYMLLLAVVHGLRVFSGLGLDLTLVKFTSAEKAAVNRQEMFPAIFLTRLIAGLLTGLLAFALGHLFLSALDARLTDFLIYLPALCLLTSLKELIFYYFQGLYLFKKYALANVFSAAFKFGLIFIFIRQGSLALAQLIHIELLALVACLALQFFMLPAGAFKRLLPKAQTFKRAITFGLPLYLNNLLTFLYERSSVFIIGILLDPISIALYEVAAKIPEGFQRLFSSFIAVYFPSLSKLLSEGKTKAAGQVMNRCLILLSFGAIFLALAGFLFREQLILLLFSEKYLDAATAFTVLMVNFHIIIVSYTLGYSLVSAGYAALPFKINSVASIINILANFLLIPIFGFTGAVYASLLMNLTAMAMNYFYLRRIDLHPNILRYFSPVFLLIVFTGIYRFLGIESIYMKVALLGCYLVLSFIFEAELRALLAFRSKVGKFWRARTKPVHSI